MITCLLNSNTDSGFKLPEDGYVQLLPKGRFPHPSGPVQIIDDESISVLLNRFAQDAKDPKFAGLLVDFDHNSNFKNRPSAAAGWIQDLQPRADGLYGKIRWSGSGEEAVTKGDYRFISPVLITNVNGKQAVRPFRLAAAALTNDPNIRGTALSNRRETAETKNHEMTNIAARLKLAPEASEESVLTAIAALETRANNAEGQLTPLMNRLSTLESDNKALLGQVVDADLTKYESRIKPEAKPAWKEQLLLNRAATLVLLESIPEPKADQTTATAGNDGSKTVALHNRAATSVPQTKRFVDHYNDAITSGKSKGTALDVAVAADPDGYADWKKTGGKL